MYTLIDGPGRLVELQNIFVILSLERRLVVCLAELGDILAPESAPGDHGEGEGEDGHRGREEVGGPHCQGLPDTGDC